MQSPVRFPWAAAAGLVLLSSGCLTSPGQVLVSNRKSGVEVRIDGELFTRLHADEGPNPFLYPVLAPGGIEVTRGFPLDPRAGEAHDHPHHVSLWFAHGDVGGADFWHADPGETFVRMTSSLAGRESVLCTHEWVSGGEVRLTDRRAISFGGDRDVRWIDHDIVLMPTAAGLVFGDTKEGTFALRLAPRLRVEGEVAAGTLLDSEGRTDADVWGKRARWVAASGPGTTRGGRDAGDVTVAVFDHPANPRHPTWWHARTYGLLAANPFGQHDFEGLPEGAGDLRVPSELRLRYRVWLTRGRADAAALDAAWSAFAQSP